MSSQRIQRDVGHEGQLEVEGQTEGPDEQTVPPVGPSWARARGVGVGWDGSLSSREAVRWAAAEAAARRSPLTVLHGAGSYAAWLDPVVYPDVHQLLSQVSSRGAEAALAALGSTDDPGAPIVEVGRTTALATPQELLLTASADLDLLVVGNRGRGELTAALRGSVSFAVAARARCPVVVVRGDELHRPGPDAPVVLGFDGSDAARAAASFAAEAAVRSGAELEVLQVLDDADPLVYELVPTPELEVGERAAGSLQRRGEELLEQLHEDHPGLRASQRMRRGDPARLLADESVRAGLVVVGSRGRGRVRGLLLGSTSTALVHRARRPVAVVHGPRQR